MTSSARTMVRRTCLTLAILSAVALTTSVAVLIIDHVTTSTRETRAVERLTALEDDVKTDASAATTLAQERRERTDAQLEREAFHALFVRLLISASAAFLLFGKAYAALRGFTPPPRESLLASDPSSTNGVLRVPASKAIAEGIDEAFLSALIQREGTSPEAAIPILQAIQEHYRYLPDDVLRVVCERTQITPAQIAGVSTFYANFRRSPVGRHVVKVCHGTACHVAGARELTQELRRHLRIEDVADTDPARRFTLDRVACLGCCSIAPVLMVDGVTAGRLTPASACEALETLQEEVPT